MENGAHAVEAAEQELGVFSTPVTLINDEVVIGFDRQKLERLLGLTGAV